jgi:hypothetical protein
VVILPKSKLTKLGYLVLPLPAKPHLMSDTVYQRIEEDPSIVDDTKVQVIGICTGCMTESELSNAFNEFATQHRLLGEPAVCLDDDEVVGHVKNLRGASKFISDALNMDIGEVEAYFRSLSGQGPSTKVREAKEWFQEEIVDGGNDFRLSLTPCWLFREATERDAQKEFDHADVSCLPARLGLPLPEFLDGRPYPEGQMEFLGYCVPSNYVDQCRTASFLDGTYVSVRDVWIIGGTTQPIAGAPNRCINAGGLEEVVAIPPLLENVTKFYVFFN